MEQSPKLESLGESIDKLQELSKVLAARSVRLSLDGELDPANESLSELCMELRTRYDRISRGSKPDGENFPASYVG